MRERERERERERGREREREAERERERARARERRDREDEEWRRGRTDARSYRVPCMSCAHGLVCEHGKTRTREKGLCGEGVPGERGRTGCMLNACSAASLSHHKKRRLIMSLTPWLRSRFKAESNAMPQIVASRCLNNNNALPAAPYIRTYSMTR